MPENRGDEEYFTVHRDQPDVGLFISRPMLHHGAYAIVLSRRITGADGSFLGVVAGSIRFSYFHDLFGRLHLGPDDIITVLRRDGTVIMRTPFDLDVIGKNLGDLPGGEAGAFRTERILFRALGDLTSRAAVRLARRHPAARRPGRQAMDQHSQPVAHRGDPDRRDHDGADPVRARA